MKIDIRHVEEVTEIVIADKEPLWLTLTSIGKRGAKHGGVSFNCISHSSSFCLHDREGVDNLIRALEKAKELNWV